MIVLLTTKIRSQVGNSQIESRSNLFWESNRINKHIYSIYNKSLPKPIQYKTTELTIVHVHGLALSQYFEMP